MSRLAINYCRHGGWPSWPRGTHRAALGITSVRSISTACTKTAVPSPPVLASSSPSGGESISIADCYEAAHGSATLARRLELGWQSGWRDIRRSDRHPHSCIRAALLAFSLCTASGDARAHAPSISPPSTLALPHGSSRISPSAVDHTNRRHSARFANWLRLIYFAIATLPFTRLPCRTQPLDTRPRQRSRQHARVGL